MLELAERQEPLAGRDSIRRAFARRVSAAAHSTAPTCVSAAPAAIRSTQERYRISDATG